jgi:Rad3-related DNA helicase
MTYKEKEETFKKQKFYIEKIIDKYKGDKGIIHCTTYEFSNWIQESVFNKRLLFHTSQDREERLEEHLTNGKDSVIVSPSMHTGVDLKDDFSRFQILMKIPYPNISSNKVKQRQKTKPEWYSWKTNVDLIQALGRSVRSMYDKADSYILDSSLSTLLMYNGNTIPRWITNAIKEIKK